MAAFCILDNTELICLVVDILCDITGGDILLDDISLMLDVILNVHSDADKEFAQKHMIYFQEYSQSCTDILENRMVPKQLVLQFFGRRHINSLWPLFSFARSLQTTFCTKGFIEKRLTREFSLAKKSSHFCIMQYTNMLCKNKSLCSSDDENTEEKVSETERKDGEWRQTKKKKDSMKLVNFLLIEDSIVQRKMIVKSLRIVGGQDASTFEDRWAFGEVGSGEEAIKAIKSSSRHIEYDVIIVDQNLGGTLFGHEVIQELKQHYNTEGVNPEVIIIGCTRDISTHASNFFKAGADSMWRKPLQMDVVESQLRQLLISKGRGNATPSESQVPIPHSNGTTLTEALSSTQTDDLFDMKTDEFSQFTDRGTANLDQPFSILRRKRWLSL